MTAPGRTNSDCDLEYYSSQYYNRNAINKVIAKSAPGPSAAEVPRATSNHHPGLKHTPCYWPPTYCPSHRLIVADYIASEPVPFESFCLTLATLNKSKADATWLIAPISSTTNHTLLPCEYSQVKKLRNAHAFKLSVRHGLFLTWQPSSKFSYLNLSINSN